MGWEQRGNATYYYTATREGGRVVKKYFGAGRVAELAAQLDTITRAENSAAAEAGQLEREELAALDAELNRLHELAEAVTVAALVSAGFHRPKRGKWRKRRG